MDKRSALKLVSLIALCGLGLGASQRYHLWGADNKSGVEGRLERRVTWTIADQDLSDLLQRVSTHLRLPVIAALPQQNRKVSARWTNVPLREVLNDVAQRLNAKWQIAQGRVVFVANEEPEDISSSTPFSRVSLLDGCLRIVASLDERQRADLSSGKPLLIGELSPAQQQRVFRLGRLSSIPQFEKVLRESASKATLTAEFWPQIKIVPSNQSAKEEVRILSLK
jgi:type II secretory pathway component GspD/PulD (secretin)